MSNVQRAQNGCGLDEGPGEAFAASCCYCLAEAILMVIVGGLIGSLSAFLGSIWLGDAVWRRLRSSLDCVSCCSMASPSSFDFQRMSPCADLLINTPATCFRCES